MTEQLGPLGLPAWIVALATVLYLGLRGGLMLRSNSSGGGVTLGEIKATVSALTSAEKEQVQALREIATLLRDVAVDINARREASGIAMQTVAAMGPQLAALYEGKAPGQKARDRRAKNQPQWIDEERRNQP